MNFDIKTYEFYYKLRTLAFVREIWMFGSRAKNNASSKSDIDLAILCEGAADEEWNQITEIIDNSDTLLKIDCIRFDTLSDQRLKKEIEDTKLVLFKRVQTNHDWYNIFLDLGEALEKFEKVLALDKDNFPFATEAAIQIFEFCFELYWKLFKKICKEEGLEVASPRSAFQSAYTLNFIKDEKLWLLMIEDRNLTSHAYNQSTANLIYSKLKVYSVSMSELYSRLKEKYKL